MLVDAEGVDPRGLVGYRQGVDNGVRSLPKRGGTPVGATSAPARFGEDLALNDARALVGPGL